MKKESVSSKGRLSVNLWPPRVSAASWKFSWNPKCLLASSRTESWENAGQKVRVVFSPGARVTRVLHGSRGQHLYLLSGLSKFSTADTAPETHRPPPVGLDCSYGGDNTKASSRRIFPPERLKSLKGEPGAILRRAQPSPVGKPPRRLSASAGGGKNVTASVT